MKDNYYSDSTNGKHYQPWEDLQGRIPGTSGLGSEYDYTFGDKGFQAFGVGGAYEAKQGTASNGTLTASAGSTESGLNGTTLDDAGAIIAHSPEAQSDLTALFQDVLGRAPGAAELVGMEDQLGGGASQTTLNNGQPPDRPGATHCSPPAPEMPP